MISFILEILSDFLNIISIDFILKNVIKIKLASIIKFVPTKTILFGVIPYSINLYKEEVNTNISKIIAIIGRTIYIDLVQLQQA